MDFETIRLILEITVAPCITFFITLTVTVLGAWISLQFNKSLERYKKTLSGKDKETSSAITPSSDSNIVSSKHSTPYSNNNSLHWVITTLTGGTILYWTLRVITRGTIVIANLFALIAGTLTTFFVIRPFGINFIQNRVNELILIPRFYQIYYEITSFFSFDLLANLYLFGVALVGGLAFMFFTEIVLSFIVWIFD